MWWVKPRFSVLLSEGRNQSWSVYLGELFSSAGVFFAKLWNYHQRRNLYFNEFDEADSMTDRSVVVAFTPNSAYNLVDMFDLIKRSKFAIMPIFSVQDGKIMSIKTRCLGTKKTERWLFLPISSSFAMLYVWTLDCNTVGGIFLLLYGCEIDTFESVDLSNGTLWSTHLRQKALNNNVLMSLDILQVCLTQVQMQLSLNGLGRSDIMCNFFYFGLKWLLWKFIKAVFMLMMLVKSVVEKHNQKHDESLKKLLDLDLLYHFSFVPPCFCDSFLAKGALRQTSCNE